MSKLAICLALAGITAAAGGAAAAEGGLFPYPARVETLDNGLTVILVPMSSGGLVSFWSVVRTGARDEVEPGRTGFAHFFEHMMFRGTERYPAAAYTDKITELGADSNAFTSDDLTAYHLAIAAEDLESVMDIESDRFKNLSYSEAAFRTEAGAVYGEYRKNRTNPFFTTVEAVRASAFTVHTYGHLPMGFERDIQAMPTLFDYSRSFFARFYRPENTVLLISGDFEVEPTLALVGKYYGDWQPGYVAPEVPAEPEQTAERRLDVSYPGRSLPIVWIAYKSSRFDPDDRVHVAADLLAGLAFGETSELYKRLVLSEQVVEFVDADLELKRDPGTFTVVAQVKDPAKVDYVLAAIDAAIGRYQQAPPDAARLADLKARLKYGFLMGLDSPDSVNAALARFVAITGGIEAVDRLFASYATITPEDVQAAANAYLVPARRTIAVLRGES